MELTPLTPLTLPNTLSDRRDGNAGFLSERQADGPGFGSEASIV